MAQGEFRSEERLMLEQALLQEEKQAILRLRLEIEREAAEAAKMQAAMTQAIGRRGMGEGSGSGAGVGGVSVPHSTAFRGAEEGGRREEDQEEDYLNEPENGNVGLHDQWREVGGLDLNTR